MRRQPEFVHRTRALIYRFREKEAETDVDTQASRNRWIRQLENLFDQAAANAMPVKQEGENLQVTTPKERQVWSHVAAHLGQVMGNLSKNFDETKFNEDLADLEKLVDEVEELRNQSPGAESKVKDAKSTDEATS